MTSYTKVVRVAVNNNFNCTLAEFQQLDTFAAAYPDTLFFVNSNINTKLLHRINEHPYKAIITLNPDIWIDTKQISKLSGVDQDKIAFVRIKYIPKCQDVYDLILKISNNYPVVITLQRFNGKKSIVQFVPDYREHYEFSHNRFRLFGDSLDKVIKMGAVDNIYICDEKGLGCGGCGLCSTLVAGKSLPIYTLNLSSSGMCPFNCVDCYAKTLQHFLSKIGMPEIHYDWIHMNHKQAGRTKHIRSCKKKK
jgi:hypothetical protein